ncbi:LOW QUALITY PROTEIN: CYFIP-related Rac1 interactor B-like [Liolophura sinensis]|uniref:LOW QUALITY PROTEIN: CYFIP-related Rac1 interactor B-like n=1 Tax=Liolophura sinensis TaxID=3198878 RepID=UPI0031581F9E
MPTQYLSDSVVKFTDRLKSYLCRRGFQHPEQTGSGMGNLLKVLTKDDSPNKNVDIFVDFENAQPTEAELPVYTRVQEVLQHAADIQTQMRQYKGAGNEIREAISNPRDECQQDKAWDAVLPLVSKLKHYYEFSMQIEKIVPILLNELCSNDLTPRQHLETQQALFKQFAEILDFVLKFDDWKMTNPAIQNEFSYYRRTLSRRHMANEDEPRNCTEVTNEMANRMSLFYANPTPMLKALSDTTTNFVSQHKDLPIENTTDCLSTMADICRTMIENPNYCSRFKTEETKLFCLRVMVGVIILFDHVHPVGAFTKQSGIDMKSSVKLLKEQQPGRVEGLMNALRYTTKHLHDETTPKAVKTLLG